MQKELPKITKCPPKECPKFQPSSHISKRFRQKKTTLDLKFSLGEKLKNK